MANPNMKKGAPSTNPNGRPKGVPNKTTQEMRQVWIEAFHLLQEDNKTKLSTWAAENPEKFYSLAQKLIPAEVKTELSGSFGIYEAVEIPVQQREDDPDL